jgi:pilus assembly protein Flp/PilA
MTEMVKRIKGFLADEEGATAVEYGVMVALIIAVCIIIIGVIGRQLNQGFTKVSDEIKKADPTLTGAAS